MRSARRLGLMALCLLVLGESLGAEDLRPDARIRELQILDRFAGSWTGTQPGSKRKVHVESEWILKGRTLQTKATLADGRELLILRTYDPVLKKFIATLWDSNGMAAIVSGDWDTEHTTLTTSAEAGNMQIRAEWQLVDEDTEQWQVVFADSSGKPQRQFGGTNRRNTK